MSTQTLPPGPAMPTVMQTVAWWSRPIPFLERCRARYGKTFTMRLLGHDPFVMISDPADLSRSSPRPPDVLHPGEGARDPPTDRRAELDPAARRGPPPGPAQAGAARLPRRADGGAARRRHRGRRGRGRRLAARRAGAAPSAAPGAHARGDPAGGLRARAGRAPRALRGLLTELLDLRRRARSA